VPRHDILDVARKHAARAEKIDLEDESVEWIVLVVPSRVVLEFGDAISGISRVSGQAARSIG
jgi:hypothetical protein